ncbi:hypothetical protein J6590_029690 [Homalodisca vitripennis]|nr:hypothetical protein J6590_029690 [Homalodisca vitripennis]
MVGRADLIFMLILALVHFALVQHLNADTATDLTPAIWSHVKYIHVREFSSYDRPASHRVRCRVVTVRSSVDNSVYMSEKKISEFFLPSTPRSAKRHRSSSSPELPISPSASGTMADDKVGDITQEQLMNSLSLFLDQKLANLATKEDLARLNERIEDLKAENSALREEIADIKRQSSVVVSRLVDLESRSRRNNLIFKGLKVPDRATGVDCCHAVQAFCKEVLGCGDNLFVNRANTLGRSKAVIAHLPDDRDIHYIISRVKTLRNTSYIVHRDYPEEIRQKRAKLVKVRAEVERVTGRRKMPLVFDHLAIEGCRFTWDEGKLRAGAVDGGTRLKEVVGRDFSQFLAERSGSRKKRQHPEAAAAEEYHGQAEAVTPADAEEVQPIPPPGNRQGLP